MSLGYLVLPGCHKYRLETLTGINSDDTGQLQQLHIQSYSGAQDIFTDQMTLKIQRVLSKCF